MDNTLLKKKLSRFMTPKGSLKNLNTEVLAEYLVAWESWSGSSKEFYSSVGISRGQAGNVLRLARKLSREGGLPVSEFKEINLEGVVASSGSGPCTGIELSWDQGKLIRFPQVEQLVDFLKKVA